jgi:hypothetical protein
MLTLLRIAAFKELFFLEKAHGSIIRAQIYRISQTQLFKGTYTFMQLDSRQIRVIFANQYRHLIEIDRKFCYNIS